ncbi:MAG: pyrroline-5-carboxylate reductase [Terrimicrobiaceae bacterium]
MALVHGLLRSNVCAADAITVSSRSADGLQNLSTATGIQAAGSNSEAVEAADIVIVSVKPPDVPAALETCGNSLQGRLLISVATGQRTDRLEALAPGSRVVRAMPNTAAMVGRSSTALVAGSTATRSDMEAAETIFSSVGKVFTVMESQMDAITGLSGSGPAFVYLVLEALSDGAVAAGLPRKLAAELAVETLAGAAEMAAATSEHPAVLREMVTSPAGTTIAGLLHMEECGVRAGVAGAVLAAAHRARELAAG